MSLNLGIIASQRDTAAPPSALLLDTYPGAAAAYSLRKLRTAYTGPAIRVIRSSDNAQTDIGFVNNILDTTTLTTFVGSSNGLISVFYDQSGNSNNATAIQTFAPDIVVNGVLQTQNSKPCINFRATLGRFLTMTTGVISDTNISIFMTSKNDNSTDKGLILSGQNLPAPFFGSYGSALPSLAIQGFKNGSSAYVLTTPNYHTANYVINNCIVNSTDYYIYQNNSIFTNNVVGFGLASNTLSQIGRYANEFSVAKLSELVFYKTDQTSNRIGIVSNTNTFYSIF